VSDSVLIPNELFFFSFLLFSSLFPFFFVRSLLLLLLLLLFHFSVPTCGALCRVRKVWSRQNFGVCVMDEQGNVAPDASGHE
jgi:hypothetical protein